MPKLLILWTVGKQPHLKQIEIKTVKQKLAKTLDEFAQSKSDAVSIEATQFEKLEKDYRVKN